MQHTLRHIKLRLFRDLSTLKVSFMQPIVWKVVFFVLHGIGNKKKKPGFIYLENGKN